MSCAPKYLLHKTSGQAIFRIFGKDYYLRKFGTPESKLKYKQYIVLSKLSKRHCRF